MTIENCMVKIIGYIKGEDKKQTILFSKNIDEYISDNNFIRIIDEYINQLDLKSLLFKRGAGIPLKWAGRPITLKTC